MARKVTVKEVYIESGPPGFSGRTGWLSGNFIFLDPQLKPGEEQVGPRTSFRTFTDKWRCNTRPLEKKEKKDNAKRDAIDNGDGHGQWRT